MNSTESLRITTEQVRVIDRAIAPVVRRWNLSHSLDVRSLARDCYFQGLLDGASPSVHERIKNGPGEA